MTTGHMLSAIFLWVFFCPLPGSPSPPPHHPPKPHPLSTAPVSPVMGNICCLQRIIAFYLTQSFCLSCSPPVFIFTLLSRSQTQYLTKHRTDIYGPTGICRLKERNGKERKGKEKKGKGSEGKERKGHFIWTNISQVSHLDFSLSWYLKISQSQSQSQTVTQTHISCRDDWCCVCLGQSTERWVTCLAWKIRTPSSLPPPSLYLSHTHI